MTISRLRRVLPQLPVAPKLVLAIGGGVLYGLLVRLLFGRLELPLADLGESITVLNGIVLGVLLVFRNNAAYDRWWEGRKLWGQLINLWGDSFAPVNPEGQALAVPLDADPFPHQAEPLGGLLALFTALFEDDVRAVYLRGGLTGYESLLGSQFSYVPHDALIPGALTAGDLCDVAAALAPRPLRMEGLVDGLDRAVEPAEVGGVMEPARSAYRALDAGPRLQLGEGNAASPSSAARWLPKAVPAEPAPSQAK